MRAKKVLTIFWFLIFSICIILCSIKTKGVSIKIETLVDKLKFRAIETSVFSFNQEIDRIELNGFDSISIEATRLKITEKQKGYKPDIHQNGFILEEGDGHGPLYLKSKTPVALKEINFKAGEDVIFHFGMENSVKIESEAISGDIESIGAYIDFDLTNAIIKTPKASYRKINGQFSKKENEGNFDLLFGGSDDPIIKMYLNENLPKNILIQSENSDFLIDKLFLRKLDNDNDIEGSREVSSIKSGTIDFLNLPDNIILEKGDELKIEDYIDLKVKSLDFTKEGIKIIAYGKVGTVNTGITYDRLRNQNPSTFKWLWHNKRLWLLSALSFAIFFTTLSLIIHSSNACRTVLFLAANPSDAARLALEQEFIKISQQLQNSCLKLVSEWKVSRQVTQEAILEHKPQILHFSGHGVSNNIDNCYEFDLSRHNDSSEEAGGLLLVDLMSEKGALLTAQELKDLLSIVSPNYEIEALVLNACYSLEQAQKIIEEVPYIIAMKKCIKDSAAIAFSIGFYNALAKGFSIKKAYQLGISKMIITLKEDTNLAEVAQEKIILLEKDWDNQSYLFYQGNQFLRKIKLKSNIKNK